jgi:hypothetical protein
MKKIIALGLSILFTGTATQAASSGSDQDNIYFGGGLGSNSASGLDSATGFQIFAGYKLDMIKLSKIDSAVEVGYMDTGDMKIKNCSFGGIPLPSCPSGKSTGLWATYVASYKFNKEVSGIARLGLDIGDDDGLMYGLGVGYKFDKQMALRGEYVKRQHVDSLQVNFVYSMK